MSINFDAEPAYTKLVQKLLQRTREGKIKWDETAESNTFVASVQGRLSFKVIRMVDRFHLLETDDQGQVVLSWSPKGSDELSELHTAAERVAKKIDQRIGESIKLLDSL